MTTHRLRDVALVLTSNVDKVIDPNERTVRLCNYVDVYKNNFIRNDMPFKPGSATAAEIKKFGVQVHDVIITKDSETADEIGVPALVKSTAEDLVCGYHLSILRADRRRMIGPFLYWHLLSKKSQEDFGNAANGVTRFGLTLGGIKGIPVNVPDLATQRQIADFLDRETERIDLLIEKKQRFASGVEDEFVDRVSHLVTIGANDDVPRKQSGYSWHPTLQEHWTVTRLKFLCARIVDCLHETPEHIEDGDYPSIRTSDLIRGSVDIGNAKRISADEYGHRIQRLEPKAGDILYTREGERFGLAALVPPETKLCLGQRMMMFRVNRRALPAYLMWSLNGKFAYNFLKQDVTGATSPHLNIFDIRNVPVFLPPVDEQQTLVAEIDTFFEKKSQLIEKTLATIDRLKEYRSALITAAVTGQIDMETHAKSGTPDRHLDAIQEEMGA